MYRKVKIPYSRFLLDRRWIDELPNFLPTKLPAMWYSVDLQEVLKGSPSFPCTLLMTTICPFFLSIMWGRSTKNIIMIGHTVKIIQLTFCQPHWPKEIHFHDSTVNLYICFYGIATGTDASVVDENINVSIYFLSLLSLGWNGCAILKIQLNHFGWKPNHFIRWLYIRKVTFSDNTLVRLIQPVSIQGGVHIFIREEIGVSSVIWKVCTGNQPGPQDIEGPELCDWFLHIWQPYLLLFCTWWN